MLNTIFVGIRFFTLMLNGHRHVALENAALRQQLAVFKPDIKRPRLHRRDRLFCIGLRTIVKNCKSALVIVRPETVMSWQRKRFKRYWWRFSQSKGPGRPPMSTEIRKLVRTMAAANVLWGAPRIHGELLKLGFEISERTVSRLMPKRRKADSGCQDQVVILQATISRFDKSIPGIDSDDFGHEHFSVLLLADYGAYRSGDFIGRQQSSRDLIKHRPEE